MTARAPRLHPSILSADFARLADELARIPSADAVHVDVMDNHFVPNLTLGLPVVEAIRRATDLPLDLHLMIEDADRWAPGYAEAGAESVTFHAEASAAPVRLARELRAAGAKAGMALRPATAVEPYLDMLPELDMLLLMTVDRHPAVRAEVGAQGERDQGQGEEGQRPRQHGPGAPRAHARALAGGGRGGELRVLGVGRCGAHGASVARGWHPSRW